MNGLLHAPWLSSLGWALVHSLWEGALVALGTALLLRSMQGATSRSRYLVVSANQVVHPNSGKLKAPTNSSPGDSGEPS